MATSSRTAGAAKRGSVLGYLRHRHDPLTSLVLTVPVFLVYHLGILLIDLRNGVDVVTQLTFRLLDRSMPGYIALTLAVAAGLVGAAWWLRRRGRIRPVAILPVLLESALLSIGMLLLVGWATEQVFTNEIVANQIAERELGAVDKVVMAAGAGFHEELVFRAGLFAGVATLLWRLTKLGRLRSWLVAGVASSLLFSAVHYIGPLGDELSLVSFTFRFLSGIYLAVVYWWRGFAVAVYTHTLYDVLVFFVV